MANDSTKWYVLMAIFIVAAILQLTPLAIMLAELWGWI